MGFYMNGPQKTVFLGVIFQFTMGFYMNDPPKPGSDRNGLKKGRFSPVRPPKTDFLPHFPTARNQKSGFPLYPLWDPQKTQGKRTLGSTITACFGFWPKKVG